MVRVSQLVRRCDGSYQATAEEHDGDRDMFEILRSPCTSPGSKMFEEDIGAAVEPDDKGLDELR